MRTTTGTTAGVEHRALLLTRDAALAERLERLAAAAGAELDVQGSAPDPARWSAAVLVLVGADLADEVASRLPRRPRVFLVSSDSSDSSDSGGSDGVGDPAGAADGALWRRGLEVGAEQVVRLPAGQDVLVDVLAQAQDGGNRCAVVGVVGGCGGAGGSVLASGIAVTAALGGRRTLLTDLDPLGGGLDVLLGAEQVAGLRWPDLASARGRLSGGMLREALPRIDGLSLLSWDRADPIDVPGTASAAVAAGAARGFDVVVLDLTRHLSTVAPEWLRMVDLGLVVLPAGLRALAGATRVVPVLSRSVADLQVVVRGPTSGQVPSEALAEALGIPLLGELRAEPGLAAVLERGEPPGLRPRGPLARLSGRILDALPRPQVAA
jgi:secretion/DNA translocation related CpaE-like protein